MKIKAKVTKEIDIRTIMIDIEPRYIGDSDDDDIPSDFPLLNEEKTEWRAVVNIDTGVIDDWPEGDSRSMFVKVCDAGIYSLFDESGECIAQISGYVPHGVVPGEYGDYVKLEIDGSGKITNWPKSPDVSEFFNQEDD